jgi:hypothetical protein
MGASGQVLKWIREGVTIPFLNNRTPSPLVQPRCLPPRRYPRAPHHRPTHAELARFVATGAWAPTTCSPCVSKLILFARPGINKWRFIVDLRHLNNLCVRKRLRMELLLGVRHLRKKSDYMFSFDLKDIFTLWQSFQSIATS